MARGIPDWYMGANIAYQDLAQMIVRPKYGGTKLHYVTGALPASTATLVMYISGTGMHYGAYFYIDAVDVVDNDYLSFYIDGESLSLPVFGSFINYNFATPPGTEPFMTFCDRVNHVYAGCTGMGKTWETAYALYYNETYGRNPLVTLYYYYALLST